MISDHDLMVLAEHVGRRLLDAKCRVVTAESCTGGWVAKALTDVAGSSEWFERGFVTYSNAAKVADLGVALETLKRDGAVSEATVKEMAAGALRVSGADIAIAISGIAGPGGGSVDKPVGTVWIGKAVRMSNPVAVKQVFDGDREAVRRKAVKQALELLLAIQYGHPNRTG
jgi:nicotinamide-nucleotide amidase